LKCNRPDARATPSRKNFKRIWKADRTVVRLDAHSYRLDAA
jgi:hypothetical protein